MQGHWSDLASWQNQTFISITQLSRQEDYCFSKFSKPSNEWSLSKQALLICSNLPSPSAINGLPLQQVCSQIRNTLVFELTMALKSFLFVSIMLATVTAPIAEAQFGLIGGILGLIRIQGTVFCTANGNMGVNGTATPAFPRKLMPKIHKCFVSVAV